MAITFVFKEVIKILQILKLYFQTDKRPNLGLGLLCCRDKTCPLLQLEKQNFFSSFGRFIWNVIETWR